MAASCETLGKVTEDYADRVAHGRVKMNTTVNRVDPISEELGFQNFTGKPYRGSISSEQAMIAADTEAWESSAMTTAKNAAIFAACIENSTGSQENAVEIVEAITGSKLNANAANAARVPVSYAKREILVAAKHAHSLFSQTNLQQAAVWEDQQFASTTFTEAACIDWSRVTLVARYLAEANMRYDPRFCEYARVIGVPYVLVTGAWATAFETDYALDVEKFRGIKSIDIRKFGVPRIDEMFENFSEDVATKALKYAEQMESLGGEDRISALLRLALDVKVRRKGKAHHNQTGTSMIQDSVTHSLDAGSVTQALADSRLAPTAVEKAASALIRGNDELLESAKKLAVEMKSPGGGLDRAVTLTREVFTAHVWVAAQNTLTKELMNPTRAAKLVDTFQRTITKSSSTYMKNGKMTYVQARTALTWTGPIICRAAIAKGPIPVDLNFHVQAASAKGRKAMYNLLLAARTHYFTYRKGWAQRYQDWSDAHAAADPEKKMAILYGAAASAFRHITPELLCAAATRFIDPMAPGKCYLMHAADGYARKRKIARFEVKANAHPDAQHLAESLDKWTKSPVTFVEMEEFVHSKLAMLAGDFSIGAEPEFRDEFVPVNETPCSEFAMTPGEPCNEALSEPVLSADLQAKLEAILARQEKPLHTAPTYDRVVASYPSVDQAEAFAKANGYESFEAAFSALGTEARYDDMTSFCRVGNAHLASLEAQAEEESAVVLDL